VLVVDSDLGIAILPAGEVTLVDQGRQSAPVNRWIQAYTLARGAQSSTRVALATRDGRQYSYLIRCPEHLAGSWLNPIDEHLAARNDGGKVIAILANSPSQDVRDALTRNPIGFETTELLDGEIDHRVAGKSVSSP